MPLIFKLGNIMDLVADVNHRFQVFFRLKFAGIDDQGPSFGFQGICTFHDHRFALLTTGRGKSLQHRFGSQTQR